jgi:hypothetical protein
MEMSWRSSTWRQFGAAIDMLDNALSACPDELWQERLYTERGLQPAFTEFWYIGYHALFWLDYYLSDSAEGFAPPAPFTLSEFEGGVAPARVYTKAELQAYLAYGRDKCQIRIESQTELLVPQRVRTDWPEMSVAEMMLYNMRHVQDHAAQLSLFLAQRVGSGPGWVSKARGKASEV